MTDWDKELARFRADEEPTGGNWPCRHHGDENTELCGNCDTERCTDCLDSCPCLALEKKGIYLSFGCTVRCCFCEEIDTTGKNEWMVQARARWGYAFAHTGCILIRACRLKDKLDAVLAKPEPLTDVFVLVFDQVMPELFEGIDRKKIALWCEAQEAMEEAREAGPLN